MDKKTSPKSMMGRFRNKGVKSLEDLEKQCTSSSIGDAFYVDQFPPLPKPSTKLKELLLSFNELSKPSPVAFQRRSRRKKKKTKLNAFIAFRSFYARYIKGVESQKKISSELAKVWKTEPNKEVWKRYVFEYSKATSNTDFVDWLCGSCKLRSSTSYIVKIKKEPLIDDIFLVN